MTAKILRITFGFVIIFFGCQSIFAEMRSDIFNVKSVRDISTQYFSVKVTEISLGNLEKNLPNSIKAVGDGAITPFSGDSILYVNVSGAFTLVNLSSGKLLRDFLPRLDTGAQFFINSKFYKLIETAPRILGIVRAGDFIYASYNCYDEKSDRMHFCISKSAIKNPKWIEIYRTIPIDANYFAVGNGGKLAIYNGKLFFTIGDQSLDRANGLPSDFAAQNPAMPWGKTFYSSLTDYPLKPFVCSSGHRNPQGLYINPQGTIYETEHGPRGGDELNIIKCGGNYGWPHVSYGTSYWSYGTSFPIRPNGFYEKFLDFFKGGYIEPAYFFTPSPALSSLIQVSNFSKEWNGDLLLGSLKAASIYRVKLSGGGGRVQNIEQIYLNNRVRDISQVGSQVILLTDGGTILLLSKSESPLFPSLPFTALNGCLGCHVLNGDSKNSFAPSLANVYGSKLGASNYEYSSSFLSHKQVVWNEANLRLFLLNPQSFIPGTKMPSMNYTPEYVDKVIRDLKALKNKQK